MRRKLALTEFGLSCTDARDYDAHLGTLVLSILTLSFGIPCAFAVSPLFLLLLLIPVIYALFCVWICFDDSQALSGYDRKVLKSFLALPATSRDRFPKGTEAVLMSGPTHDVRVKIENLIASIKQEHENNNNPVTFEFLEELDSALKFSRKEVEWNREMR